MIEIIPAILPKSFEDLEAKLDVIAGKVPLAQIDVTDGKFVPSVSWPYGKGDEETFEPIAHEEEAFPHWRELDIEVDLMVAFPEEVIEQWINAGVSRAVFHLESNENIADAIAIANDLEVEVGLALDLDTALDRVDAWLPDISFVQLMGIKKIGYQGQPFDPRVIKRIKDLRARHHGIKISVDGGVDLENAELLIEAGANRLIVGSALIESGNFGKDLEAFKKLVG